MKPIRTFTVSPSIPEKLHPLKELDYNFRWAWNHATIELFRRLDSELWEKCYHNPVLMLGMIHQHTLESVLNDEGFMSTLDGWWDEAYSPGIGWAIGRGESYDDPLYQDQIEAEALYDLLEEEIIPLFYERGVDGMPRKWVSRMKESIATLCHFFNTNRMAQEYTERFYYVPASRRYQQFLSNGLADAKKLSAWKESVQKYWQKIKIESVTTGPLNDLKVNVQLTVQTVIYLGNLTPVNVTVEIYYGKVDALGTIIAPETSTMDLVRSLGDGKYLFEGRCASCQKSGNYGLTIRVLPFHPYLATRFLPGLISWSQNI